MILEVSDICSGGERPVSRTGYHNCSYFSIGIQIQHQISKPLPHREADGVIFSGPIKCNCSYRSLMIDQDIIIQLIGS